MAEVWDLPDDALLKSTRPEWLLHLLHAITEKQRALTLLIFWRALFAHNEITHAKPCPPIEGSRRFLVSYLDLLLLIKQYPNSDVAKGKMVIDHDKGFKKQEQLISYKRKEVPRWRPPEEQPLKLNTDGAFSQDGRAGCGMILRDQQGAVIFAACRHLTHCHDAAEAEIMAIQEGVRLALQWSNTRFTVESDCSFAVDLINGAGPNISVHAFRINDVRELLRERNSKLVKISRFANCASHELAKLARLQGTTRYWHKDLPLEVASVVSTDCNPVSA
jgi:ribonuclease HI